MEVIQIMKKDDNNIKKEKGYIKSAITISFRCYGYSKNGFKASWWWWNWCGY